MILKREEDRWAAVAIDYTVTGVGASPEEAQRELKAALRDYLEWCARDGLSLAEAHRPISRKWRLELEAAVRLAKLKKRFSRDRDGTREVDLPVSWAC